MITKLVDAVTKCVHELICILTVKLVQGHSGSTLANFFSLETAKPIEAKFVCQHFQTFLL